MNIDKHLKAIAVSFALLTRIPMPNHWFTKYEDPANDLAVCYYPVVGLFLALILSFFHSIIPETFSSLAHAAILVIILILVTGAIHLDGVIDSFDAMFAGHKSKEIIFKVFKDPNTGAIGVVSAVAILLLKVALIESLISSAISMSFELVIALLSSRLVCSIFIVTGTYVSQSSLDAGAHSHKYQNQIFALTICWISMLAIFLPFTWILSLALTQLALFWYWQKLWHSLIGGYTGDNLGALVEMSEIVTFMTLLVLASLCN